MNSRKRGSFFDLDTATLALLEDSNDDLSSDEEPCMQDAEEDSFVPFDYDDLDLMSDSNIKNTSDNDSDSGGIIVFEILLHQTNLITIGRFRGNARNRFIFTGQPGLPY